MVVRLHPHVPGGHFVTITIFIDMGRKQKKYHYIYKIVNALNGKYYYGMHSTDNLEDGYMGSGRRIKHSINKHGKNNHKKEIIQFLNSREELKSREKEIVNLNEISKKDCMNISVGGLGGIQNEQHREKFIESLRKSHKEAITNSNKKQKWLWENDEEWSRKYCETLSKSLKGKDNGKWTGRKHSEESKKKMSDSMKGKYEGKNNPSYGTQWITDGSSNKKIKKDTEIPKGWYRGRK